MITAAFFESQMIFCANPRCTLHVRGNGNWARLSNGLTVGRSLVGSYYLCDLCQHSPSRLTVPVPALQP